MRRWGNAFLLIAVLAASGACASATKPAARPAAPAVDWKARLAEADALAHRGHYTALREALRIYGEALAVPGERAAVAERTLRAAIALELRRKDLGILTEGPGPEVDDPSLSRYNPWLELVAGLPNKIKGSPGIDQTAGRTLDGQLDWIAGRIPDIDRGLEGPAGTDDLAAALRLTLRREFFFKFQDKLDRAALRDLHAGSPLVAFQAAVCPAFEAGELGALLRSDAGFAEVHYYLGDEALLAGKLLTAERHYLAAFEKIPESLSVLISLAKVAFQTEETETCLEWNEKALALLPTYRDAILGKGLALGYLGRSDEALGVLGRLLELGTYYMGEGHYWTAWNLNELGRLEEARRSIDAARVFLVGVSDVAGLSGVIAYRQGRLDDAEKDLREALDLDPAASDAAFYLGRLYADRKDWLNSAVYFAGAAMTLEDKEKGLEKKIEEIEASEMAPERRARLVVKKRVQILSVQATKATCQYNGAAGYHNAGKPERALELARQAAAHPAFADKAAELIKIIRDR
ncbi:MAG: tetratricopeptide repeat protein [Candidatus Aminicenantes bacterium]|nr:tetratricopeptide repeat protein [Candidatus Aminicenantes bacterium]